MVNVVLAIFAGSILLISAFSAVLQRASLPGPLLALASGVVVGPHVLALLRIEDVGVPRGTLLEEACRVTLAVGLAGVALRLPHGYWRANMRWVVAIIGVGMVVMLVVATGVLWGLLGLPFLVALLFGAIITPTDPVVTTPIVTGTMAETHVPSRVRFNLSAESGLNDGLGYLFVFLPVLLITRSAGEAWFELLTRVLVWEVLGGVAVGAAIGFGLAKLFNAARRRAWMEESSYLGYIVPLSLATLGAGKLMGLDAILAVFIAASVFGQLIPESDEDQEDQINDVVNRFLLLPVFILLGVALPIDEWVKLGAGAPLIIALAVLARRAAAVWAIWPIIKRMHNRYETTFMSWFGAIGVSALFYATLAERLTASSTIFTYVTLAITLSVVIHGLTSAGWSVWLQARTAHLRERNADLA